MSKPRKSFAVVSSVASAWLLVLAAPARAEVIYFDDKESWMSAVESQFGANSIARIDFTQFDDGEVLFDQLVGYGLEWLGPTNTVITDDAFEDGHGVGATGELLFPFTGPRYFVGFENVQSTAFDYTVFLSYENDFFSNQADNPLGGFLGVISDQPFDAAFIGFSIEGDLFAVDNVYVQVPAPAALGLFGVAFLAKRRRRIG